MAAPCRSRSRRCWWRGTGSRPGLAAPAGGPRRSRTRGCRRTWRRGPRRSRHRSSACPRGGPSSAARRRRCRRRRGCRPGPGSAAELLVEHRRELARRRRRDVEAVHGHRRRVELAVEVVEPDDGDRLDAAAALDHREQDLALAVLRLGDAEHVGQRRGEVDRARLDGTVTRRPRRRRGTSRAC